MSKICDGDLSGMKVVLIPSDLKKGHNERKPLEIDLNYCLYDMYFDKKFQILVCFYIKDLQPNNDEKGIKALHKAILKKYSLDGGLLHLQDIVNFIYLCGYQNCQKSFKESLQDCIFDVKTILE